MDEIFIVCDGRSTADEIATAVRRKIICKNCPLLKEQTTFLREQHSEQCEIRRGLEDQLRIAQAGRLRAEENEERGREELIMERLAHAQTRDALTTLTEDTANLEQAFAGAQNDLGRLEQELQAERDRALAVEADLVQLTDILRAEREQRRQASEAPPITINVNLHNN